MRLTKIRIQNFRSFVDQTIDFSALTVFVGPNGAGKSNVLNALNIFFRTRANTFSDKWILKDEDFHRKVTGTPITITLTFTDLSKEAQEDFKAYYRNNELIISAKATWSDELGGAEVRHCGSRMGIKDFADFFKAMDDDATAQELKAIFARLRSSIPNLPTANTKPAMEEALRNHEGSHPEMCVAIESNDQFYGWTKGSNLLAKYIQWVYIPAVKDAALEQDESKGSALGSLLARTIRSKINFEEPLGNLKREIEEKYKGLLTEKKAVLTDISESLQRRLREWATPTARIDLDWAYDADKSIVVNEPFARASVGEESFVGEVARLGHGLQRTFIVSLLQELAVSGDQNQPILVLGFEEPELYQHPPQARHLAAVLEELVVKGGQVIATTHSPYFVSTHNYEGIRRTDREGRSAPTRVVATSPRQIRDRLVRALPGEILTPTTVMAAVEQIMQPSQNELFFSTLPVLVEGPEDVAYISTYMHLSGRWSLFRQYGCHFITATGKTSLSRPLAIALELGMPVFVVIDSDMRPTAGPEDDTNRRDNGCILSLMGITPLPTDYSHTLLSPPVAMYGPDLPEAVKTSIGTDKWNAAKLATGINGLSEKNSHMIAATLEKLWNDSVRSDVLEQLCAAIIESGKNLSLVKTNGRT